MNKFNSENPLAASDNAMNIFLDVINSGEDCPLIGSGNSMRPFLKNENDILMMTSVKRKKLKVGDIVLYRRSNGQYVIHRLYKICTDGTFCFVGDNQYWVERNISREQIIAKAKSVITNGKAINCEGGIHRQIYTVGMLLRVNTFRLYRLLVFLTNIDSH